METKMSSFKDKEFQLVTCLGKHGSYTFYKSLRVGDRTLSLSNFFPVRIWPDSAILSIAEVQLLWKDRNESLCSLRLYFLPENTPFGRFSFHGEDEVIALQDKVIIRASDLMTWLVDEQDWDWGYLTPRVEPEQNGSLSKGFLSQKYEKEDKLIEFNETGSNNVVVLNYDRYVRLRTVLKRLEGSPDMATWFSHPLVMAIGGVGLRPNCRLLFAKDVFDYPELEDHELLCNHLAPKLKGRQGRKKNRTRRPSTGSLSNESESSSTASSASTDKVKPRQRVNGLSSGHPHLDIRLPTLPLSRAARIMEERGLEALQRELLLSTNANGLQILKVDSSRVPKNGQIGSSSGGCGVKRSHNQQPLRVDTRGGSWSSSGRRASGMEFGPGLNELAQKLRRSNALQILAIRPPMGGGGMNDLDMFQLKKRMKLDPEQEIISTLLGSDMCIHPLNSGPFTARKHTIYGAPIIDKVVSKTHEVVKQLVGFAQTQKSSTNKKIRLGQEKPPKEPITPANIDADLREFMAIRTPSTVDSPFRTNNRIYMSPTADRFHIPDGAATNLSSQEDCGSVLDFSVRRSRQQHQTSNQITRRALNTQATTQEPVDLLDLTVRPTSFGGRSTHESTVYGRQGGNIPLPNAMDKLGLQLTSEVTLFPSPSYLGKVKENKSASSGKGASSSASLMTKMSSGGIAGSSGNRSKSTKSPAASGKVMHGASSSGGGRASASPKDVNSLRHHPYSSQHHPHMYPNHLNTKPVFGPPILSPSPGGHSSSSSITIKPMTSSAEEKQNAAKLKELEKAYQSLPASAASFMPTPGTFGVPPKVDPAYLSLLSNPFLMTPQALMSIPGAMEQFQMYKDLFQQSGIPQFPLHWPPPGPGGNERGAK